MSYEHKKVVERQRKSTEREITRKTDNTKIGVHRPFGTEHSDTTKNFIIKWKMKKEREERKLCGSVLDMVVG